MIINSAYCSWCFQKTAHQLKEQNTLSRNLYTCTNCGNTTVECSACQHMARYESWHDLLCAEHNGTVADFEALGQQLDSILDYPVLFERKAWNIKKIGLISGMTVGSAAVLGPLAFAAAPAIGGALGAAFLSGASGTALSGAAAGSAGLAFIGGGSLAAGGLGMAGGSAIIAAGGAALGGTLGGVVANSYFGDIEGFAIEELKPGKGPGIIAIDGFLTEGGNEQEEWQRQLGALYPDNPWYYLRWESKSLQAIGQLFSAGMTQKAALGTLQTWGSKATAAGASKLSPVGWFMTAAGVASNPWSIAMVKAGQTGILLADIIARTNKAYILIGHSLGARVIFYTLEALASKDRPYIRDAHLLGGAVGNAGNDWTHCAKAISGTIYNYYSEKDWVLKILYQTGTFFSSAPIGRNPIAASPVVNCDVSVSVHGHNEFKPRLSEYMSHEPI